MKCLQRLEENARLPGTVLIDEHTGAKNQT